MKATMTSSIIKLDIELSPFDIEQLNVASREIAEKTHGKYDEVLKRPISPEFLSSVITAERVINCILKALDVSPC